MAAEPIKIPSVLPAPSVNVNLERQKYQLQLTWNERAEQWYCALFDTDGNRVTGNRLVARMCNLTRFLPDLGHLLRLSPDSKDRLDLEYLLYVDKETAEAFTEATT